LTSGPEVACFALLLGIESEERIFVSLVKGSLSATMMPMTRWLRRSATVGVYMACLAGSAGVAQQDSGAAKSPAAKNQDTKNPDTKASAAKAPLTPEEKKQEELRADTEKLYQLTQELKAEVAKSNKDTLSVSVIKKAQEIERLAKSIKERTRNQ
jgi:hypothetical protein